MIIFKKVAFLAILASIFMSGVFQPSTNLVQAATAGLDKLSDGCKEKLFPVTSGGSKDEKVSCIVHDKVNDFIILAGNSSSEDYVPAANDHAFAYAVDMDGNWKWGKFFYNVSFAISTISGCNIDDKGNVVMIGLGNSVPIIMELNPLDGQVRNFVSLDKVGADESSLPWYKTFAAVYHDTADSDGNQYYYASFIMQDILQIIKINSANYRISWNFQFSKEIASGDPTWPNRRIPGFLAPDPKDSNRLFLIGQFNQRASVIGFDKSVMSLDYKLEIQDPTGLAAPQSAMNEIYSYVIPQYQSSIFGCGYQWVDPVKETYRKAVAFKADTDGQIKWMKVWGNDLGTDLCRAVTYDTDRAEAVFMLEVTSKELRPDFSRYSPYSDANNDVLIITIKDAGTVSSGFVINMGDASVSLGVGGHSLLVSGDELIFGAQSWGFNTKHQNITYDLVTPYLDSHIFKLDPRGGADCFYTSSFTSYEMASLTTSYTNDEVADLDNNPQYLFKPIINQYIGYPSKYSGSFDLADTFRYPKMCATKSINMTDGAKYYRGSYATQYVVGAQSNAASAVTMMDLGATWLFQNGSEATGMLGNFSRYQEGGTVNIKTESQDAEGKSRTIIRGCSRFNELLELYLYIDVMKNTYPDFVSEIETSWTVAVDEVFEYQLPEIKDDEGNDTPVVYIANMTNQPPPPFLFFDSSSRTLKFRPDSIWYQGLTYYFMIVIKEENSDTIMYPYYCTVKVSGVRIDPEEYLNFTDITFKMTDIDRESKGALIWSHPVNLTFVKENWDSMFDVYIKNVTFRAHNTTMPLLDFNITHLGEDQMTMNFTCTFDRPYLLGLLVKKSDKLYIHMKYDLLDVKGYFLPDKQYYNGMILGNTTTTRLWRDYCQKDAEKDAASALGSTQFREKIFQIKRIDMQFDFRNDQMYYMRQLSIKTYWYICGVVAFQFVILFVRNVGFLPVWTLIEYMQLVSFIPLYNFRMIPYLYDAFKPFLVAHLVLTNETFVLKEMQDDYFNINYDYYWLSIAKLGQSLALICALFSIIICLNILVFVVYLCSPKESRFGKWIGEQLAQFKFNVYIRYYMLCYFDLTFFSTMKLIEGNDSTELRKIATMASYIIFTLSVVVPVFLMSIVCKRFEVMKIKEAKQSFNTIVLKIDKQSRWRLIQPGYFFFRRLLTAVLLSMPIENTFIFLQYVFILMSSHAYVLYLVAIKPYQSPLLNNYVLSNETFYSALIIAIFIFSDATPELNIKFGAGVVLITSIFLLILANFLMIVVLVCKGKDRLKEQIREAKLKRAEKELMEEEEEEERRQRQKKEEEEFTRLPEDTTNMSHYDLNSSTNPNLTTTADMLNLKGKKKKSKKNKNKNDNDEVDELTVGAGTSEYNSEMGNTTSGMLVDDGAKSTKKKKKKRKDKNKNKADNVEEATIGEGTEDLAKDKKVAVSPKDGITDKQDEPTGSSSSDAAKKDKKKKKKSKSEKDEEEAE